MLERIGRLAGQINRHRNQQAGFVPPPPQRPSHHHRTSPTDSRYARRARVDPLKDAGYYSGWRRGLHPYRGAHRGGRMPVHRNRTLVLNGNGAPKPADHTETDSGAASDASTSSWVTKNDRHLQLINSSVYQKESQSRVQALEQTRQQKLAMKNKQERAALLNHLNRTGGGHDAANKQASNGKYTINVQGVEFIVTKNGSKLVKAPGSRTPVFQQSDTLLTLIAGDGNSAKATPKMATIGGVKFYRSKNGNLYRHGIVKAQRYVSRYLGALPLTITYNRQSGAVKKVNVPCNQFSMTGNILFLHFHGPNHATVSNSTQPPYRKGRVR